MKTFMGIDPGLKGAYAVIAGDEVIQVDHLPVEKVAANRLEIDGELLYRIMETWPPDAIAVEKVGGLPKQSAPAAFRFGQAYGQILEVAKMFGCPVHRVAPGTWKRTVLAGWTKDKEARRAVAGEIFPDAKLKLTRKKDQDRADALLIAEWLRRTAS